MNPIKIKTPFAILPHFRLDTDRDGVEDYKDCRPFNPKLQHVYPNQKMREEIRPLNIWVSDRPGEKYHVLSKEAKKKAPRSRAEMLSAIKKYPSIVGDIKKAQRRQEYLEEREVEDNPKFEYTHTSWVQPERIASNVRFQVGKRGTEDLYLLGQVDASPAEIEKAKALEPFKNRFAEISSGFGKQMRREMYAEPVTPEHFKIFDEQTEAIVRLGMIVSEKKEVDNFISELQKEEEKYSADPHKYRGPYSGSRKSSHFATIIQKGTHAYHILNSLNLLEENESDKYPARWTQIKSIVRMYDDMNFGTILHKLINAGMIYHRGEKGKRKYYISKLGKGVLQEIRRYGKWESADYVPQRAWYPAKREHTAFNPYKSIESGSMPHRVMETIAKGDVNHGWIDSHHDRGLPTKKETFRRGLHMPVNDVTSRKLENTGLVYRPKRGWYRLTRKGIQVLKILSQGRTWYNEKYDEMLESSEPPYARPEKKPIKQHPKTVRYMDYGLNRPITTTVVGELPDGKIMIMHPAYAHLSKPANIKHTLVVDKSDLEGWY